jgi:DNA-binding helix-hairpin-helix protein with protein kinase domain
MLLRNGSRIDLGTLGQATVVRELGQGGQGYVYAVERDGGRMLAFKWYKPHCATTEQKDVLTRLVGLGAPHPRFLWPLSIGYARGASGFGYAMPLKHERFVEMGYLISGKAPDGSPLDTSFAVVISMCRLLADTFLRLHSRGLCYRDISFGNVAFDPSNGDVRICDNDNVDFDNGTGRVLGTPFFMAPELVRDATFQTLPNSDTDRHSLAVLLFYALCMGHPLEGQRTELGLRDGAWLTRHFGTDPLFTFDPSDASNRPASNLVEAYWKVYPRFLHEAFIRAFGIGLMDPASRVTESEWIKVLGRLRDVLVQCAHCGATNFMDEEDPAQQCARCHRPLERPLILHIGRRRIVVSPFAKIRSSDAPASEDDTLDYARVRRHPFDPSRWGLENLSGAAWVGTLPDGSRIDIAANETVDLIPGLRLEIQSIVVDVRR